MNSLRNALLRNRYTLLFSVLALYIMVIVTEGAITGREARLFDFNNPFFDLNVNNIEDFMDERREEREAR